MAMPWWQVGHQNWSRFYMARQTTTHTTLMSDIHLELIFIIPTLPTNNLSHLLVFDLHCNFLQQGSTKPTVSTADISTAAAIAMRVMLKLRNCGVVCVNDLKSQFCWQDTITLCCFAFCPFHVSSCHVISDAARHVSVEKRSMQWLVITDFSFIKPFV